MSKLEKIKFLNGVEVQATESSTYEGCLRNIKIDTAVADDNAILQEPEGSIYIQIAE